MSSGDSLWACYGEQAVWPGGVSEGAGGSCEHGGVGVVGEGGEVPIE